MYWDGKMMKKFVGAVRTRPCTKRGLFVYGYRNFGVPYTKTVSLVYGVGWLEERSDDALCRAQR